MTDGPNALGFDYFYGFTHARNIGSIIKQDRVVANVKGIENQPMMIKKALQYLEDRSKEKKPFFLYFPMCPPHSPIVPAVEFEGKSGMDGKEGKLYNGGQYTVLEATYEKVRLKDDRGDEFTIKTEVAVKQLRMTHALTYACIEGLTLPGRIRLCDADHRNFDWRKLNVGLSRGTAADLVEVE